MKHFIVYFLLLFIVMNSYAQSTIYFVRTSTDTESWSFQENENNSLVLSIDDISLLTEYPHGTTFYMASGCYTLNGVCSLSGFSIYGGFSGKESAITDLNKRVRYDLDSNDIVEPWEMKHPTYIQGDISVPNDDNEKNNRLELLGGTILDGVTIRNIHSGIAAPVSVGSYINGYIDAVEDDPGNSDRGELVNCIVENLKTGPSFTSGSSTGLIGIGHYSIIKNCHVRNCETRSGVTQFINMSGYKCELKQSVISNNTMNGSGVYIVVPKVNSIGATPIIENCIFADNKGGSYGLIRAIGKQVDQESLFMKHCTFANNNNGGEIIGFLNSSGKVSNSILYSATSASSVRRITSGATVNIISCLSSKSENGATNINSLSNFTNLEQYNFNINNYKITTPHLDSDTPVSGDDSEKCEVDLLGYSRLSPYTIGAFQIGSNITYPDPEIMTGIENKTRIIPYYDNQAELFHVLGYEQSHYVIYDSQGKSIDSNCINNYHYTISMRAYAPGIYFILIDKDVYKIVK